MMIYALTALLSFVVFISPAEAEQKPPPIIEPRAVLRMMDNRENIVFINVLSFLECMDSRIPASRCIACEETGEKTAVLPQDRNAKLVFYGGNAPVEAGCEIIREAQRQGFANLYLLKGGLTAWKRAGYEVESINRIPRVPGPALKPGNLKAWLNSAPGALMIDLRSPAAYQSNHITGAVNMPLATLHRTYQDLPWDRPLLVIDADGSRSFLAVSYLRRKGFENVHRLEGGMVSWQARNKGGAP
ncbi:MAG: rhodanese-like domain-containing protein [Syntrophales bacterium]|nr:rhodanese-like domain-containing protein [Syntrophales bacterium]MCK9392394.1 rhodanese-like domain-containing protein [Syntrophales bacterium]